MVLKKTWIKRIVGNIVERLQNKGISVDHVYLFGSYAWGKPTHTSDLDIAVISPQFRKWNDIKRIEVLSDIARYVYPNLRIDIDALGFTRDEIKRAPYFDLASEIRQRGKIIYKKAA